jgi:hypothetical protein
MCPWCIYSVRNETKNKHCLMHDFRFQEHTMQIANGFITFWQTFPLTSSGLMYLGWGLETIIQISDGHLQKSWLNKTEDCGTQKSNHLVHEAHWKLFLRSGGHKKERQKSVSATMLLLKRGWKMFGQPKALKRCN